MNPLEITEQKADVMNKLEDSAMKILQEYFDGQRQGGDDVVTARNVLNTIKGNRQTSSALLALEFNIISSVAQEKELTNYVKIRHPKLLSEISKRGNPRKKAAS
jgi:hypothetical protein